ncbi:MAG TPA: TolC family protein [Sphingomonas sp.]
MPVRHHGNRAAPHILTVIALSLSGCATSSLDKAPAAPDRPWQPATTPSGEIVAGARPATGGAPSPEGYVLPSNPAVAGLPAAPTIDPARTYDLPDLIDLAEATNPETRIAWNEARNAALAAGIARSSYLPRITASALGGYQTSHGHGSALGTGAGEDVSATGSISALSLQWLLFDFGERSAVVAAVDQGVVIANIAFTAAHQKLIHDVSLAFYLHSAARARVSTVARSLKDAQDVEAAAEDRYKHGIGTVIEVAQARQATAQAHLAQVQADGAAQDAYITLLSAMGIPPLLRIKVADASDHKLSPAIGVSVEQIIASALARRPDVLAAYAAQKASLASVKAAQAEFLPKFFVSASGAYTTGGLDVTAVPSVGDQAPALNLSGRRLGATILGGVTMPLYDGGTRDAMLAQARARADNAGLALDRVKDEAVRQIVMADNALKTSLATHEATGSLVAAAQTTYDAALAAYRHGVGASTDVLMAERQLLEARNAATDSYSTALSAAATLALATGSLGGAPR